MLGNESVFSVLSSILNCIFLLDKIKAKQHTPSQSLQRCQRDRKHLVLIRKAGKQDVGYQTKEKVPLENHTNVNNFEQKPFERSLNCCKDAPGKSLDDSTDSELMGQYMNTQNASRMSSSLWNEMNGDMW